MFAWGPSRHRWRRSVREQPVTGFTPEMIDALYACFDDFNADNDPHGEHDFGAFQIEHLKFFWKIDYYDKDLCYGSENPTDPDVTERVLTLMLAEEY